MKMLSPNWNILFVDDSRTEINYLKLLFQLTDNPLIPSFINSAQEAIEILENMSPDEFPDIVVVDINMPLLDGFEFAKIYNEKFSEKNPNTRLFIYSTSIHSTDIIRAENTSGVSGFIAKPFGETTFKNKIYPLLPKFKKIPVD
jgi:Response regulator containing a CheY-like receiver domain and an HTH DNA-binding domain